MAGSDGKLLGHHDPAKILRYLFRERAWMAKWQSCQAERKKQVRLDNYASALVILREFGRFFDEFGALEEVEVLSF